MAEKWTLVGYGLLDSPFDIIPGVNVWDYQWFKDQGGRVQIGDSPTGPFLYLDVYVIVVGRERITFAADDNGWGYWTFYRLAQ